MDLIDTIPTRNRSWTLPQSNTGLCNITNQHENLHKKRHRKHKSDKTAPYKRRSKRHNGKIVDTDANIPIPKRQRSRSRPRLSQAKLFQLDDKEISAKRKKKEEFLVHRVQAKQQKKDETIPKHVKRERKRNKKLCHIKENAASKPSTNSTHAKKRKKKRRRAVSSLSAVGKKTYTFERKQYEPEIDEIQKRKRKKSDSATTKSNIYSSKRKKKKSKETTNDTYTKKIYKRRKKHRDRAKTGSHGIDLNEINQIIKEQSTHRRKPKLSNHRSYNYKNDKKDKKNKKSHKKKKSKKKAKRKSKTKSKEKLLDHTRFYRSKRKKQHHRLLNEKKNDRKISNMYEQSISPSPQAPQLNFDLIASPTHSPSVFTSDSDLFSPQNMRCRRSKTVFEKPTVCIQFSPKMNEAVFIGYRASGPTYKFRGRGKEKKDHIVSESPSPPEDRFTFRHITSQYKPHRIQWSSRTGFTDSELDDDDDDESEPSLSTGRHNRAKTEQINRLLAHLLTLSDEDEGETHNDINSEEYEEQDVIAPLSEDDEDEDGELLFDIDSFVSGLSKKRNKYDND